MGKEKQAKHYQELTFLITAVLMLIILIAGVSWSLSFLLKRLNIVLNPNALEPPAVIQFNIKEFKKLDLIKIP
ncbi:hypothetical protein A3G50_03015 [Candidatus Jorgensenbacteria bacterium RIFCSPLOWO2_12_FULL_42_11]|uniref:Uncharacterized protein n=1 Tax=Candidatus Jorgensenbacteria bacterium RIFCSPLOWO2_12_FULL_42_11 TaxID=1798473 RepID=A0A1F6C3S0_9BACT|nr:MAG: hypothetical protein A3G50_03015 [Candidatus Jorgensenbacteria bacterium RIFCSPLOWO2_12_FULL_42_11]